jgi:hypothetical protein
MVKTLNTPQHKRQGEGNTPLRQLQTIFKYLEEHIATASMVADATGIYQKNICRYKRDLEKAGRLWETEKKLCKKTGFKAWYLTTNPEKAQKHLLTQLNLF